MPPHIRWCVAQAFDELVETHGLWKADTIGDAYVVVGGLFKGVESLDDGSTTTDDDGFATEQSAQGDALLVEINGAASVEPPAARPVCSVPPVSVAKPSPVRIVRTENAVMRAGTPRPHGSLFVVPTSPAQGSDAKRDSVVDRIVAPLLLTCSLGSSLGAQASDACDGAPPLSARGSPHGASRALLGSGSSRRADVPPRRHPALNIAPAGEVSQDDTITPLGSGPSQWRDSSSPHKEAFALYSGTAGHGSHRGGSGYNSAHSVASAGSQARHMHSHGTAAAPTPNSRSAGAAGSGGSSAMGDDVPSLRLPFFLNPPFVTGGSSPAPRLADAKSRHFRDLPGVVGQTSGASAPHSGVSDAAMSATLRVPSARTGNGPVVAGVVEAARQLFSSYVSEAATLASPSRPPGFAEEIRRVQNRRTAGLHSPSASRREEPHAAAGPAKLRLGGRGIDIGVSPDASVALSLGASHAIMSSAASAEAAVAADRLLEGVVAGRTMTTDMWHAAGATSPTQGSAAQAGATPSRRRSLLLRSHTEMSGRAFPATRSSLPLAAAAVATTETTRYPSIPRRVSADAAPWGLSVARTDFPRAGGSDEPSAERGRGPSERSLVGDVDRGQGARNATTSAVEGARAPPADHAAHRTYVRAATQKRARQLELRQTLDSLFALASEMQVGMPQGRGQNVYDSSCLLLPCLARASYANSTRTLG